LKPHHVPRVPRRARPLRTHRGAAALKRRQDPPSAPVRESLSPHPSRCGPVGASTTRGLSRRGSRASPHTSRCGPVEAALSGGRGRSSGSGSPHPSRCGPVEATAATSAGVSPSRTSPHPSRCGPVEATPTDCSSSSAAALSAPIEVRPR